MAVFVSARSLAEYESMFSLTPADLAGSILDCAAGAASFGAEVASVGGRVLSVDPLYRMGREQVADTVRLGLERGSSMIGESQSNYDWTGPIKTPADHASARQKAADMFLEDFRTRSAASRYLAADLSHLPFGPRSFDLAVCSHLLFVYAGELSVDFQVAAILEMARVANEVRVFPLVGPGCDAAPSVAATHRAADDAGLESEVVEVAHRFLRGTGSMLRLRRAT